MVFRCCKDTCNLRQLQQ